MNLASTARASAEPSPPSRVCMAEWQGALSMGKRCRKPHSVVGSSAVRRQQPAHPASRADGNAGCNRRQQALCCCTGAHLDLPEGFKGHVLCQQSQPDDRPVVWQSTCKFSGLTYWNHDAYPAAMDGVPRMLEWLAVAKAVRPFGRMFVRSPVGSNDYSALTGRANDAIHATADGGTCLSRGVGTRNHSSSGHGP